MTNLSSDIVTRAEARLGTVLRGKYRLDRVLGVGGMAVVYKATHRNQAQFAIKMLHPEVSLSMDIRSRFLREGYAANSIKHPGAVLVVDDDVAEDGSAFLVMELLDGIGCDELADRQRLSPEAASAILIQLLDVLASAHANGIVHRDIKPANLFLTRNGVAKVLDFGIARAREAMQSGAKATGSGMMLGTPAYMAPEQASGRSREIDGRTDLWAAGATFFTLVSGQLVHQAETAHEMMIGAATTPARSLSTVAPHVPPALVAVIDRALAFRKEDRWATAKEMRDALMKERPVGTATPEAVVASLIPGSARPAPPPVERTMQSGQAGVSLPEKAVPARSGPKVAQTTSSPISSDPEVVLPTRSRRWAVGTVAGIGLGIAAGVLFVLSHRSPASRPGPVPDPIPVASYGLVLDAQPAARQGAATQVCAPRSTQCFGPTSQTCSAAGQWVSDAVTAGKCGAACTPGASPPRCNLSMPQTCDSTGQWQNSLPCNKSSVCRDGVCALIQVQQVQHQSQNHDCDINYTLDDQGQKHFKPECFLKK